MVWGGHLDNHCRRRWLEHFVSSFCIFVKSVLLTNHKEQQKVIGHPSRGYFPMPSHTTSEYFCWPHTFSPILNHSSLNICGVGEGKSAKENKIQGSPFFSRLQFYCTASPLRKLSGIQPIHRFPSRFLAATNSHISPAIVYGQFFYSLGEKVQVVTEHEFRDPTALV